MLAKGRKVKNEITDNTLVNKNVFPRAIWGAPGQMSSATQMVLLYCKEGVSFGL